MQRVVRSTFAGFLALAAITACGDKVTVPPPTTVVPSSVVHSVTVTPATLTMSIGQKAVVVASVDADAGVTDRTVTWTSSNAAVATVDASGNVTAVGAGTASIIAASHFDATVKGAALVTVGAVQNAAVTISSISSNATGQLVNQNAVSGQIDVAINFTPGSQAVSAIQLAMNCNAAGGFPAASDTVVAQQVLSSSNIAAAVGGDAASADIINLSVNTASFNSGTGVVAFRNGACTLRAKAVTSAGTQVASNSQTITLTNTDFVLFGISTTPSTGQLASATGSSGQLWNAGAVNVTAVPVIFTAGRSITSGAIALVNAGNDAAIGQGTAVNPVAAAGNVAVLTGLTPASGGNVFTATFPNSTSLAAPGVGGAVVDTLGVTVTTIDNAGNAGPTTVASAVNFIRLDNRGPDIATTAPTFVPNTQGTNGQSAASSWVGKNFVFSSAAGSLTLGSGANDNGSTVFAGGVATGVGKVTVNTLTAPAGSAASAFVPFTSVNNLPETSTATANSLRLQFCDALGNCTTQAADLMTFGVDLTPPVLTVVSGPANQTIFGIGAAISTAFTTGVNDPQGANGATGSGPSAGGTPILATETVLVPNGTANGQQLNCVAGFGTAGATNTGCKAAALENQSFTGGATNPGLYTLTMQAVDQAGNTSPAVVTQYLIDQNAPSNTGGIAIPAAITAGATFTTTASDSMDVAAVNGDIHYPIAVAAPVIASPPGVRIITPGTLSAVGAPFDNVLTRSASATITLPSNFYRSLGQITGAAPAATISSPQQKADSIDIRALDAAGNLSTSDGAAFPGANVSTPTLFTVGTGNANSLQDFSVSDSGTVVAGSVRNVAAHDETATLIATITAPNLTSNTPFSQVCFYVFTPNGTEGGAGNGVTGGSTNDLFSIGCTSTVTTTDNTAVVPNVRTFTYRLNYNPPINTAAGFGSSGTINIVAIGSSAAGDALMSPSHALTLTP